MKQQVKPRTHSLQRLTLVLFQSLGELVDRRGDLDAVLQDDALSLKAHIAGPFDEAAQVALGLNRATNAVVTRVLLKQVLVC